MPERYRCAPDVAWVDGSEVGDQLAVAWLTLVPDGSPVALEGSAWLVWVALTESAQSSTAQDIVERVQRLRGTGETTDGSGGSGGSGGSDGSDGSGVVTHAVGAEDLVAFLDQLAGAGLVERR
ncbi:hypothetical protein GCM10027053_10910 [Intrasporangium mesophilum]